MDLEATTNGNQLGEVDLSELGVARESEGLLNLSEVAANNGSDRVVAEVHGAVDVLERRKRDAASINEGDVVGPNKVRERHRNLLAVELKGQGLGNVGKANGDGLQVLVVVNVEASSGLEIDTLERVELSVRDANALGISDLGVEVQADELGKSDPGDAANTGEGRSTESSKGGELLELELSGDAPQPLQVDGDEVASTSGNEVSLDLLKVGKADHGEILTEDDITLEGVAAGNGIDIGLAVELIAVFLALSLG